MALSEDLKKSPDDAIDDRRGLLAALSKAKGEKRERAKILAVNLILCHVF